MSGEGAASAFETDSDVEATPGCAAVPPSLTGADFGGAIDGRGGAGVLAMAISLLPDSNCGAPVCLTDSTLRTTGGDCVLGSEGAGVEAAGVACRAASAAPLISLAASAFASGFSAVASLLVFGPVSTFSVRPGAVVVVEG